MKVYRKILAGLMALSMMATFMVGCDKSNNTDGADNTTVGESSADNSTSSNDNNSTDDNNTNNTADTSSTVEENKTPSQPDNLDYTDEITDGVVMTVGGHDINMEEYRYYFLNLKKSIGGDDETYWDGTATEGTDSSGNNVSKTAEDDKRDKLSQLKNYVITYLVNNYCVEQIAKDNNISLTADEIQAVQDKYDETKASYESNESSEYDTFEDYLTSTYCTKELYIQSTTRQALEEKVVRSLYEDDFRKNLLPQYIHCEHILFSTTNVTAETEAIPDDATDDEKAEIQSNNDKALEEAKSDVRKKAEEVLQKIKDGADFDEMVAEYNEDPGETVNEDGSVNGYYFKSGTMVQAFEDAAFALGDNEVSDLVETDYGYHIIKKIPITDDDEYINKNILSLIMYDLNTGENTTYYTQYLEMANKYYDDMEVTFSDEYYNINTKSLPEKSSVFPYIEPAISSAE